MIIVFLDEAEGELVVDQKVVCSERQVRRKRVKKRKPADYFNYMVQQQQKKHRLSAVKVTAVTRRKRLVLQRRRDGPRGKQTEIRMPVIKSNDYNQGCTIFSSSGEGVRIPDPSSEL